MVLARKYVLILYKHANGSVFKVDQRLKSFYISILSVLACE